MTRAGLIVAALVIVGVVACTLPTEVTLYNNTATEVTLMLDGKAHRLEQGAILQLDEIQLDRVALMLDGMSFSYHPRLAIPEAFISWRGWGPWTKRSVRLQIESDGKVWVVEPGQVLPVDAFVVQPEGYPLEPSAV